MFFGHLRIDRIASPPWSYRGEIALPDGRKAFIEAAVQEDAAGRFFALRGALQPGMTAVELEAALTECERTRAAGARAKIDTDASDELPF
jgi:hypothetical protein